MLGYKEREGLLNVSNIFISFAHVDDEPTVGEKGWITLFTNALSAELSRRMGRSDNYSFWKDFRLRGNDAITPEIEQQIQEVETLLILFSPGWLASDWCQRELELFQNSHPDINKRIFVVELDQIAKQDQPISLQDLLNFPFWKRTDQDRVMQLGYPVPEPSDREYFERLVNLSHDIANTLKTLQASPVVQEAPKATVYVAPVNDSLFSQRLSLISELHQFGIDALPRNNDIDGTRDTTLAQCSHFVQLLDGIYAFGIPRKQLATAEAAKKPILQWRDSKLDLSGVQAEQQKLLEGKHVVAVPLADFIRLVREAVLPKPLEPVPPPDDKRMVFVHASPDDFDRAHWVAKALETKGYGFALPRYEGEPERIRKTIERGFQCCDVLLVIQQNASADVVEDYLSDALVNTRQRESKPLILICQCASAEELYFVPLGVSIMSCCENFGQNCLDQFLAKVDA